MKASFHPVIGYVLSVAALIVVSLIFIGPVQSEFSPLPTDTTTAPHHFDCNTPAMNMTTVDTYRPNAPFHTRLAPPDLGGDPLIVSGTIYAADQHSPLPGALIEVWQTDAKGQYDYSEAYTLRAQMVTDANGQYQFFTIKPGHFRIDCQLLPAHIQFRVTYLDQPALSTALFFEGDPHLANMVPMEPGSVQALTTQKGPNGPILHSQFDIVLPVSLPIFEKQ